MKKIMNIATQKNENTDNLNKTIVKTNEQLKKKQMNVNEQWTTVNKALQFAKENQQKLVSNEENNETLMNDIKK